MIAHAVIQVYQRQPHYTWSSSLVYGKPKGEEQVRWYEISFRSMGPDSRFEPYAIQNYVDADYALSHVTHTEQVAFGPKLIDDEMEAEFHSRWSWLLQHAAIGKLNRPQGMPIDKFPPDLL